MERTVMGTTGYRADHLRGMREKFLADYVSLPAAELTLLFAIELDRLEKWVGARLVLRVNDGLEQRYPLFQFLDGEPNPATAAVMNILSGKLSAWQIAFWFTTPNAWTGSWRSPLDVLGISPVMAINAARQEIAADEY